MWLPCWSFPYNRHLFICQPTNVKYNTWSFFFFVGWESIYLFYTAQDTDILLSFIYCPIQLSISSDIRTYFCPCPLSAVRRYCLGITGYQDIFLIHLDKLSLSKAIVKRIWFKNFGFDSTWTDYSFTLLQWWIGLFECHIGRERSLQDSWLVFFWQFLILILQMWHKCTWNWERKLFLMAYFLDMAHY